MNVNNISIYTFTITDINSLYYNEDLSKIVN
jgi:hypothetical protein